MRMPDWLTMAALRYAAKVASTRKPDVVIGGTDTPYMWRWYLLPNNRYFNVYLHLFMRSDDDRALHDHPFWNVSWLLDGSYTEVTAREHDPVTGDPIISRGYRREFFTAGELKFRHAEYAHRVELTHGPCWTLFIRGTKRRKWGFWCPKGWKHSKEFTARDAGGSSIIGRGCGED